ncbi:PadR family transcriptional regulator [Timonella senegalensis]|uniref:PadR family transcriptional regulator n=2 Tax=Timonella senegalensis TaxID=1465825 RepID=UPI0028B11540|nr:PadR family transcriptional regulator [Timonella senegalensis]
MIDHYELSPQLRKGLLDGCVLAVLRTKGEAYGLEISSALRENGPLIGGEGTLYPLLSRLRRDGLVETRWEPSASGPARRYYFLTAAGTAALDKFTADWAFLKTAIDPLLNSPKDGFSTIVPQLPAPR